MTTVNDNQPQLRLDEATRQAMELATKPTIRLHLASEILKEWMREPSKDVDAAARRLFVRWDAARPHETPEQVLHRQLALLFADQP